jgi:DNA invertase Pin-like site-specific DNA recombinase
MLDAIESGTINTVICKDLSRFGRNYYESGMYLDNYFIEKHRFIAPGNSVDSANGAYNLSVPILNMMNDFYARDFHQTRDAKKARPNKGCTAQRPLRVLKIRRPASSDCGRGAAVIVRHFWHGGPRRGYNKMPEHSTPRHP